MKKPIVLSMWAFAALLATAQAQSPVQWERSFGGADTDFGSVAATTRDGGYILGGYSYSEISGVKESAHYGGGDFWIVKLNSSGARQWDASFGGENYEGIHALQQTADGGYILGGVSFSGLSGNKSAVQHGEGDFWIVKVDSSGAKEWDRALGGSSHDVLRALQQTTDGGYIVGGVSASPVSGNKTSVNYGATDYWVVKFDAAGDKQWERSFGGSEADELQTVRQTRDGGYILCGNSSSPASGNKTSGIHGDGASDGWVVKLDANGQKQWEQCLGGDDADELCSVLQTGDGGYIAGGTSDSTVSGNKSADGFGGRDYWIVKLDAAGQREWEGSYGGDDSDELHSIHQTSDGGYVVGGLSSSRVSGNKSSDSGAAGAPEYWMLKLDAVGQKQWEQSSSGSFATGMLQLQSAPGGYVLAGLPSLTNDLDSVIIKFGTPLMLHSFSSGPDRTFQVRADGTPGAMYALEASPDFVSWTTVLTSTASAEGIVTFAGTSPANVPKRFFRLRKQP
jgi:hypothetical protein